jgi:hypothetical protein
MLFLYQLFDNNLDGFVDKEEFKSTLMMFLNAMLTVRYDCNHGLEEQKRKILSF